MENYFKILWFVVIIQTFHMIEHIVQVMQVFLFNIPRNAAHGLLGILDFEWVHFLYNASLLLLMLFIFQKSNYFYNNKMFTIFATGIGVESYHMIEHVVKIQQHIQTGVHGTPGILGNFIDSILFHFFINLVVYIAILYAFIYLTFIRKENSQVIKENSNYENNILYKRNAL